MLHHLFRGREDRGTHGDAPGPVLASHILAKFLKRLQAKDRPCLLDLGHVSGANIEFFARARCKVQVDDLLRSREEPPGPAPGARDPEGSPDPTPAPEPGTVPMVHAASDAARPAGAAGPAPSSPPRSEAPVAGLRTSAGRIGTAVPVPPERPGQRPSRRIVLPPRTFPRSAAPGGRPGSAGEIVPGLSGPAAARRSSGDRPQPPLPRTIPYADESFDAIVAWDIFNYYDAASIRGIAGEVHRVLRPGGLLLAYFHARSPQGLDVPRRFRILDDRRVACDPGPGDPLRRHLYQNRDIEKHFAGLAIVELYFLKNSMREMLLEKKAAVAPARRPAVPRPAARPRFTIE